MYWYLSLQGVLCVKSAAAGVPCVRYGEVRSNRFVVSIHALLVCVVEASTISLTVQKGIVIDGVSSSWSLLRCGFHTRFFVV